MSAFGSPTLEESDLRQKGDDPKTDQTKGVDSNLPGWQPKETRPNCRSTAGPTAQTTPLLRYAQKPWGGHPLCGRPADYLPTRTVGQWLPAPCNGGTCKRAATPEPTKRRRGLTQNSRAGIPKRKRPNCQEKKVLSNQRGWCH